MMLKRMLTLMLCAVLLLSLPLEALAAKGTVNTSSLNLRQKASTSSKALASLDRGDVLNVLSATGDWYKVTYGKLTGYVMKKYVKVSGTVPTASTNTNTNTATGSMNGIDDIGDIGSMPTRTCRPGDTGTNVKKLQQALTLYGYYKKTINSKYDSATTAAVKAFQKAKKLSADGIAGPQTFKALWNNGKADNDAGMEGIDSIDDIKNPPTKTLRPGNTGTNVKKLQQALKLLGYYKGPINSRYDSATTSAVKAFQRKKGLSQDGIAGPLTLNSLFTNSAYKTERLYWFKNGSKTIPKHAVFTVKDIKTGKTLQMKRWSGANHIDAEPLTKNDTKTLKAIYGGKWSWDRRPILVKYNGHVYAASMNGMPHGTTTINNGFPGHICIHFYGSKTHETKRVDPDHKQAEATAMKYTW